RRPGATADAAGRRDGLRRDRGHGGRRRAAGARRALAGAGGARARGRTRHATADHRGRDAHGRVRRPRARGDRPRLRDSPRSGAPRRAVAGRPVREGRAGGAPWGHRARGGPTAVAAATPRPGVPLLPMLAQIAEDFDEVLRAHGGTTALEYKYDGARIQLHREDDRVSIWT